MPEKYLVQQRTATGLETVAELPVLAGDKIDILQLPVVGSMGAAIIERGSNANGSYIKWADGTMICTGQVLVSFVGNDPYKSVSVPFPALFTVVEARMSGSYISCGNGAISTTQIGSNPAGTDLMISAVRNTTFGTPVNNQPVTYLAIGRWK